MATIRRVMYTKPVPANAVLAQKNGETWASWTDRRGKTRTARVTQTATGPRLRLRSRKYTITYVDAQGVQQTVAGYSDLAATKQKAADLEKQSARRQEGLIDPHAEQRKRPLSEHLTDFRAALDAKGDDPRHVKQTVAYVQAVLDGCGFTRLAELDLSAVQRWLIDMRRTCPVSLPPGKDLFSIEEAARAMDARPHTVGVSLRRLGLQAAVTGRGAKRRVTRAAVEAMIERRARPVGPETVNHYIRALRSFARWLVKPGRRIAFNPLDGLELLDAGVDVRRIRRELTPAELQRLLDAAFASKRVFRGLDGVARFHLYLAAFATGFRASALAALTPLCFDFDGEPATVTLTPRTDKARKGKLQPLPAEVAELLRDYIQGRPADAPVWPGLWAKQRSAAPMLRIDLAAANIPYAVEGPDGPLYADFHALRHSFITALARAGVDLRTQQELAGHASPLQTAKYSHVRLLDMHGAVEKLPAMESGAGGPRDPQRLRATGTDGAAADRLQAGRQAEGARERKSLPGKGGERVICQIASQAAARAAVAGPDESR